MSAATAQQTEPAKNQAARPAETAPAVLSALPVLPGMMAAASRFASLAFPAQTPADKGAEAGEPAEPQARGEGQRSSNSSWEWLTEKAAAFYNGAAEHLSRLKNVRDFSGLVSWAGAAAADTWRGITNIAAEVTSSIREAFSREADHDQAAENRSGTAESLEQALDTGEAFAEKKEQEKKNLEEFYEEIRHRLRAPHGEGAGLHDASHIAVRFASFSLDPKTIADLKLAILGNEIPPECMVPVRQLLAEINASQQSEQGEREKAKASESRHS